jgi:hypothetical protein
MQDDKLRDSIEREIKHLEKMIYSSLEYADKEGDIMIGYDNRNIYRTMKDSYKRILDGTH